MHRIYAIFNKLIRSKYFVLMIMLSLADGIYAQQIIPLYTDSIPNSIGTLPEENKPAILVFKSAKDNANGTTIIIFPGGAYAGLATSTEGIPIAKAFAEKGITAFVVKYRL